MSVTSRRTASPSISSATARAPASSMSATMTCIPSLARRRAVAAPMPEPPPVTSAVLIGLPLLPGVEVGDLLDRLPGGGLEVLARVVRDREQRDLGDRLGDGEEGSRLLLEGQMEGGPRRAQAPASQGEHEAPRRRQDRAVEAGDLALA